MLRLNSDEMKIFKDLFKKVLEANNNRDWKTLYGLISSNVEKVNQSESFEKILSQLDEFDNGEEDKKKNEKKNPYSDRKDLTNLDKVILEYIDGKINSAEARKKTDMAFSTLFDDEPNKAQDTIKYDNEIRELEKIKILKAYKLFETLMKKYNDPQIYAVPFYGINRDYKIIEHRIESNRASIKIEVEEMTKSGDKVRTTKEVKLVKEKNQWKLNNIIFTNVI